jgi:thioredoxin reductase (NADPH)
MQQMRSDSSKAQPQSFNPASPAFCPVGDVRSGSVKRVGAAIGEGAAVVAQLHTYLAVARARRAESWPQARAS